MAANRKNGADNGTPPADPVDWARHFWRRHQLGGSEDAFIAMSSVLRFQRLLVDAVEKELRKHELNITDYMFLMTLQLSETGTRLISHLARSLLVHATTATLATDRLEGRKLIARSPHPTDRRATMVTITKAGRELATAATESLRGINFGFYGNTEEDQRELTEILARMRRIVGDADTPIKTPRS
ncbi:MarR family transcriptional regulator [Actinomadura sp. NBRC 104425]|uniref:MarR family winged helix-turn-helix transcriptional regulator n=1 Tax=Actinomadura sp. NBRC 104425 TaxID=3032204 RepID=UPI0024A0D7ED|nr:MarR family transcriptional regulator [Actinomadura sp. NBRC 104425]GLZ15966.1 MarR family transcriptional regulator [Actinomadura sp. NBRC 104425]